MSEHLLGRNITPCILISPLLCKKKERRRRIEMMVTCGNSPIFTLSPTFHVLSHTSERIPSPLPLCLHRQPHLRQQRTTLPVPSWVPPLTPCLPSSGTTLTPGCTRRISTSTHTISAKHPYPLYFSAPPFFWKPAALAVLRFMTRKLEFCSS
eukprot:755138-Hanusia_phi.AAC.12